MTNVSVEISGDAGDGAVRIVGGETALVPRAGLRVHDPNGEGAVSHNGLVYGPTKVEVGELSNGDYGLAAVDPSTGALVDLAQLAFGMKAVSATPSINITNQTVKLEGTDLTTRIGTSRRALFLVGASITLDTYAREGVNIYVRGLGPGGATITGFIGVGFYSGLEISSSPESFLSGSLSPQASSVDFRDDLAPGEWTFWLEAKDTSADAMDGSMEGSPYVGKVTMVVMPF
ncbi:hypothetical protein [Micromonospora haikouensis]|uniref:Uncharacterized protein n=1 Tax=Micromonospora haikouensis TaxID=686309 RepID=A0A0D0X5G8_9ACTN|nr:hypothetical protein [Micromonospora haikouensis]KIR64740.1 hypothetical protein TK50_03725 [Micromonospora haikouensis]